MLKRVPLSQDLVEQVLRNTREGDLGYPVEQSLAIAAGAVTGAAFLHEGDPIAVIVGLQVPEDKRTLHVLAAMTPKAKGHALGLARGALGLLQEEGERLGLDYVFTICRLDRPDHIKWVEALGFFTSDAEQPIELDGIKWRIYCHGIRGRI